MRRIFRATLFILIILLFTACQPNPKTNYVISKNDGVFEQRIQDTAQQNTTYNENILKTGNFYSKDGSVEFSWNLNQEVTKGTMPVIEVVPYMFTGKDVKEVVSAIFGEEVIFYDLGPESERQLSKDEIQKKIRALSPYSSKEALRWLMGEEYTVEKIKKRIEEYTLQYDLAPDENPHIECDWTFRSGDYYWDLDDEGNKNNYIIASAVFNNIDYYVRAQVHNEGDYTQSIIKIGLGDGNDDTYVESTADLVNLCSSDKPTQEQIDTAKTKAQRILEKMSFGEFTVAETFIDIRMFGDTPAYSIRVEAVPIFEGTAVLFGDISKTNGNKDLYTSSYPVSQIQFFFSTNGDLVGFNMHSLTEVKEVKQSRVVTIPFDKLIEQAEFHLQLYDAKAMDAFAGNAQMLELTTGRSIDTMNCKVEISEMDYGLARFPVANSNSFYYAPAAIFRGSIDYCDRETGAVLTGTGNPYGARIQTLVAINAVDGTVF